MVGKLLGHSSSPRKAGEEEGQREKPYRRFLVIAAVLIGFTIFVVIQLIRWQVFQHQQLVSIAEAQMMTQNTAYIPVRGDILDRHHHLLAVDIFEYSLWASPQEVISNNHDIGKVIPQLAPVLEMTTDELTNALTSGRPYVLVADHVHQQIWSAIDKNQAVLNMTGFYWEIKPKRMYPEGPLGAHILGFVNARREGYFGVEGFYDHELVGKGSGQPTSDENDAFTDLYQPLDIRPGSTLVLTVDRTIQYMLENELILALKTYKAPSGSIIVMAPKSGAILGMASFPTFDPNHFMDTSQDRFANPAISQQYEPGSVFKVVTMAAGIDAGVVTPRTTFNDTGRLEVGGRLIYNWDRGSNGMVDMTVVLGKSLNTGAAFVSTTLGKNRFYTYVRRFGFGRLTGVDMAGEIPGTAKLPGDSEWHESDLGTNAFGQGIAVTPLQMLNSVAAVANRGQLMKPYIVSQVIDRGQVIDIKPEVIRRAVSENTAELVTAMLVQAVENEISQAYLPGYRVAGKTGTAEIPTLGGYKSDETIASFIGYAPAFDPQFIVLVKIDKPHTSQWGSKVAAPVFQRIAEFLVDYMDIAPDTVVLNSR